MPRAQKHAAATRYQLEKLRLDVALKRARLAVTKKDVPKPYVPPFRTPEQKALDEEKRRLWREGQLLRDQQSLSEGRVSLIEKQKKLDKALKKEARIKAEQAEQGPYN